MEIHWPTLKEKIYFEKSPSRVLVRSFSLLPRASSTVLGCGDSRASQWSGALCAQLLAHSSCMRSHLAPP